MFPSGKPNMWYLNFTGLLLLCLYVSEIQSARIIQRRDGFDPNRLMQNYMGIRTDQTSFGSFHPNDLTATIQNYFHKGDKQPASDNQWGLSLYNPNVAMDQYVGQVKTQGELGPEMKQPEVDSIHGKQNQYSEITGFNPDQLNNMLLNSLEKEGLSAYGFDPNAVNEQLMQNVNTSNQNQLIDPSSSGQSAHSGGGGNSNNKSQTVYGFDANQLNANLLNGLDYDPNSAMASMANVQKNAESTSGTTNAPLSSPGTIFSNTTISGGNIEGSYRGIGGDANTVSNAFGYSGKIDPDISEGNAGLTSSGNGNSEPSQGSGLDMVASDEKAGNSNGGQAGNGHSGGNNGGFQAGGTSGSGFSNQANSHPGTGLNTPNYSGSTADATGNGVGSGQGAVFHAGGLGTGPFSDQAVGNSAGETGQQSPNTSSGNNIGSGSGNGAVPAIGGGGIPPGVQTGSNTLNQTNVVMQAPSGIGAMGGRLS